MFKLIIVIIVPLYAQRVKIKLVTMIHAIMWTKMVIVICKIITITTITDIMDSSSIINIPPKAVSFLEQLVHPDHALVQIKRRGKFITLLH